MAEWLGRGLQNLVRRFEPACRLLGYSSFFDLLISYMPRSSRGPGRRPFTAVARVQIPYAVLKMELVAQLVRAPGCGPGGRGFKSHRAPFLQSCGYLKHPRFFY